MSTVTTSRKILLQSLGFSASMTWDGSSATISADVPAADLQAAVDAAADDVTEGNKATIDQAVTAALVRLQQLVDAPALPAVPSGTLSASQMSNALRGLRDEAQATRAGAQQVAQTLKQVIRLLRGDFDATD